jgi:hypothetical protein
MYKIYYSTRRMSSRGLESRSSGAGSVWPNSGRMAHSAALAISRHRHRLVLRAVRVVHRLRQGGPTAGAELPVFIQFTFRDGLIAGERFFFDLSELCAQSGVSTDAVRQRLFGA